MLDQITPLVLTHNEEPNIARALEALAWAREVVVVDSLSNDGTVEIVKGFPNSRVVQRAFDNHASQWNFGLKDTEIGTEWILALDADYVLTTSFVDELKRIDLSTRTSGYRARFIYCINGRQLHSGVYPPVTVLYRKALGKYSQDGHTQRLIIEGEVGALTSPILHDDRKPMGRWFESQQKYMALEAKKLIAADRNTLRLADRIRRLRVIAPIAVLGYALIVRGGVLDGWPGFYYAFQRMFAELLLSLYLIESDFNSLGRRKSADYADKNVKDIHLQSD